MEAQSKDQHQQAVNVPTFDLCSAQQIGCTNVNHNPLVLLAEVEQQLNRKQHFIPNGDRGTRSAHVGECILMMGVEGRTRLLLHFANTCTVNGRISRLLSRLLIRWGCCPRANCAVISPPQCHRVHGWHQWGGECRPKVNGLEKQGTNA